MAKGSFRFPLYTGGSTPDPAVFCPAEGYILPEDCPVPDPAVFCPSNGYVDPDDLNNYNPTLGDWILVASMATNSPGSTTFDPVIISGALDATLYSWKIGDLIVSGKSISEILDGTDRQVYFYTKDLSFLITQLSAASDNLIGRVDISHANWKSLTILDLSNNPGLTSVVLPSSADGALQTLTLSSTGISGIIDLSIFKKLSSFASIRLETNPNLNGIAFSATPITEGALRYLYANNCNLMGDLNISCFTAFYLGDIRLNNNPFLSGIRFASSVSGIIRYLYAYSCNLLGELDLSGIDSWHTSATIQVNNNPKLEGIKFKPVISSGAIMQLYAGLCNLKGTLDLSMWSLYSTGSVFLLNSNPNLEEIKFSSSIISGRLSQLTAYLCNLTGILDLSKIVNFHASSTSISVYSNPNLTEIKLATSISGIMGALNAYGCNLTGALDLSGITAYTLPFTISVYNNPNLTNVIFATSISQGRIITFDAYNCNLSGTLDLSMITDVQAAFNFRVYNNPNLTGILLPSGINPAANFHAYDCDLGYINFTSLTGLTNRNSCQVLLQNNYMTAEEVNHILDDLDSISIPGYYSRMINIGGTNAAPDSTSGGFDGLTAKASLIAKGFNVTTN